MGWTWVTPTDVSPAGTTGWQDADCSGISGWSASMAVALIRVSNENYSGTVVVGTRPNGSSTNASAAIFNGDMTYAIVPIDSSGILETYKDNANAVYHCCGFGDSDWVSFGASGVSCEPGSNAIWVDHDYASETGADTAVAVSLTHGNSSSTYGAQCNGSTDNRTQYMDGFVGFTHKLDGSEIGEYYNSNFSSTFMIAWCYLKDGTDYTLNTNGTANNIGTTSAWTDAAAIAASHTGIVSIECYDGTAGDYEGGVRINGSSETEAAKGRMCWGHTAMGCEVDGSRLFEQWITNANVDFYELILSKEVSAEPAGESITKSIHVAFNS